MSGNTWIVIGVICVAIAAWAIPYGFYVKSQEKAEPNDFLGELQIKDQGTSGWHRPNDKNAHVIKLREPELQIQFRIKNNTSYTAKEVIGGFFIEDAFEQDDGDMKRQLSAQNVIGPTLKDVDPLWLKIERETETIKDIISPSGVTPTLTTTPFEKRVVKDKIKLLGCAFTIDQIVGKGDLGHIFNSDWLKLNLEKSEAYLALMIRNNLFLFHVKLESEKAAIEKRLKGETPSE